MKNLKLVGEGTRGPAVEPVPTQETRLTDDQMWLQQQANLLLASLPMAPDMAVRVCETAIRFLKWQIEGGGFA